MFPRARHLLTVGGIDVRLDRSWFLVAGLILWSFQSRWVGEFGTSTSVAMATGAATLFFASLLLHEFGHAAEARHRGIPVRGITLFLLGGVTEMEADAKRPRDEFAVAAVGPFLSLVAGSAFGLLATVVDFWFVLPAVEQVLGLLGWLNVGLAVFNMIPAAPLDGGRVLRSAVWAVTHDRDRAIVVSARAGQLLALLVAGLAVQAAIALDVALVLTHALVGWFLWGAAQAELRHVALERLLAGERAGALVVEDGMAVDADRSLATFDDDASDDVGAGAVRVMADGQVIGALVLREVAATHPQDRVFRTAKDLMRPADSLTRIAAETPVRELLDTLRSEPLVLLELDDGRTTTLTSSQFAGALERLRLRRRQSVTAPAPEAAS